MKLKQFFPVSSVTAAALLTGSSGAQAVSWFGFEGGSLLINSALNGYAYPPDTMGAVGTTQFMGTSNGSIRIYDKMTGAAQSSVGLGAF